MSVRLIFRPGSSPPATVGADVAAGVSTSGSHSTTLGKWGTMGDDAWDRGDFNFSPRLDVNDDGDEVTLALAARAGFLVGAKSSPPRNFEGSNNGDIPPDTDDGRRALASGFTVVIPAWACVGNNGDCAPVMAEPRRLEPAAVGDTTAGAGTSMPNRARAARDSPEN